MKSEGLSVKLFLQAATVLLLLVSPISAQSRDHLTDAETDVMRYYQELDKRIEILIKAADRRFAIINGTPQPSTKKLIKDEPDWGELPKGTRAELLGDVAGILDEAITNIDDVSSRDKKNSLVSKSLRKLTEAAKRYLDLLTAMKGKLTQPEETAALAHVEDYSNQIIEAGNKVSTSPEDRPAKKKP